MYYVPDSTKMCGFYECEECGSRFLSLQIAPAIGCPVCGEEVDMEIGPDDPMPEAADTAKLIRVIEGEENVKKYDQLPSLAITGGDYEWI